MLPSATPAELAERSTTDRNNSFRKSRFAKIVLATHVVRSLADGTEYPEAECRSAFARELDTAGR
jgi:type IV secretion system protein VirB4